MNHLSAKQVLLIVGQKNYNEKELQTLSELLEKEGAVVSVAAKEREKALGRLEGYVVPHLTIAEVKVENFDAFILIGGYGAYLYLWDDEDLQKIIQQANEQHKLIAAASTATVALANAGILNGKKATVYPDYNAAVILQEKGAIHVYEDIITDDNIITSNHPQHAVQLGEAIISKLSGKNEE